MANEPKMKIGIGADTGDFDKGAKKVKQEMKDLSKVSSDAFGAIGAALGVDTRKMEQFSSALSGLGRKLQDTGKEGAAAFGKILQAIGPVAGAIAGLGIAGVTVAFKALNSEAEAFKNTIEGANMEMATAAYIDTYRQVLRDMHSETGKAVAETQSNWKKFWGTLGSTIGEAFRTGYLVAGEEGPSQEALGAFLENTQKASSAARSAEEITNEIYKLETKRKNQAVDLARLNRDIADAINTAKDPTESLSVRQKAIQTAEEKIAEKKEMTVTLEKQLTTLYQQRSDLATDSVADAEALLAQQQRSFDVETSLIREETSLLKIKSSIANATAAAAAAAKEEAAAVAKIAASRAALAANPLPSLSGITGQATTQASVSLAVKPETIEYYKKVIQASLGDTTVYIGFEADTEKLRDITKEVESLVSSLAVSTGEALGNLAADLINGEGAWGNFANAALSAFGDMAIAIGKISIEAGLASEGIKAALSLGGGWVAIAAGVALVALGTAIKSGLSNIANGNYSAGSGIATSNTSSSFNGDYEQRDVYVNVQGTLKADGDQLVAVLSNTEKKNQFTT